MAVPATAVFESQPGVGSDTANGGAFDPGSASMATDLAATVANTSAPVVTSASYNFVAGDVGAWVYVKSGTNWTPGWYKISSVASNAATLDGTIGHAVLAGWGLSTVVGCATTASPTAGTWTIDYSQKASPRTTLTAATAAGAGSTLTDATIGKNWVGNAIQVTGGTNVTTGIFFVSSTSGTTATLDRAVTTGVTSNAGGGMGGALASLGTAGTNAVAGNWLWQKGTGTVTSTANGSGGRLSLSANSMRVRGYGTTRGDNTKATLTTATSFANPLVSITGALSFIENFTFDLNSQASCTAATGASRVRIANCKHHSKLWSA
jgi:hypothetical protein